MSDTPRTDAARWPIYIDGTTRLIDIEFARTLERELATANERIAELERWQEMLSCELQHKRLSMEFCISHLASIHNLLCPEGIRTGDKVYAFKPPVELVREAWEGLSQAIRDIPLAIDAAREKEANNAP